MEMKCYCWEYLLFGVNWWEGEWRDREKSYC